MPQDQMRRARHIWNKPDYAGRTRSGRTAYWGDHATAAVFAVPQCSAVWKRLPMELRTTSIRDVALIGGGQESAVSIPRHFQPRSTGPQCLQCRSAAFLPDLGRWVQAPSYANAQHAL
jgi:hypothetical protein